MRKNSNIKATHVELGSGEQLAARLLGRITVRRIRPRRCAIRGVSAER